MALAVATLAYHHVAPAATPDDGDDNDEGARQGQRVPGARVLRPDLSPARADQPHADPAHADRQER